MPRRSCSRRRAGWPGRDELAARVRELLDVGYAGTPAWRGERCLFTRRHPGAEHGVLYTQVPGRPAEALLDPMAIDPSGLAGDTLAFAAYHTGLTVG